MAETGHGGLCGGEGVRTVFENSGILCKIQSSEREMAGEKDQQGPALSKGRALVDKLCDRGACSLTSLFPRL